jgi:hypothetical protein
MHTVRTVRGPAVSYTVNAARGILHARGGDGLIEAGMLHIRHRWYGTEILIIPPDQQTGVAEIHRCVHGVIVFLAITVAVSVAAALAVALLF